MIKTIDLNSDVGERPEALLDGSEEKLIRLITSANIACGGHAGDENSMRAVIRLCVKYGVAIGAHPGYPDRRNFGRQKMEISNEQISESVYEQVTALVKAAKAEGHDVRHVKPHGALYNVAVNDEEVAQAIARGVKKVGSHFLLYGLAGSKMLEIWKSEGFKVVGEGFADRRYEADGTLRPRQYSDALITHPKLAATQALKITIEGKVTTVNGREIIVAAQTICLHSDTPDSVSIATEVRKIIIEAGIRLKSADK